MPAIESTALESSAGTRRKSRRRFLRAAFWTTAAGGVGAYGYATRIEPHWLEVVQRELPIANLPAALEGTKLVQISDLHVGPIVDEEYLARAVRTVNEVRPDILAITGDLVTYTAPRDYDRLSRLLAQLSPARLATLAILGNHDYGEGWRHPDVADRVARRLVEGGVRVLRNEVADVSGLQIAGCDDFWAKHFDTKPLWKKWDASKAGIALCHNPDAVDEKKEWGPFQGWILAGHTHGGQCKPPFLPPPLLPCANRRYTCGEFDLYDGRRLYISRGVGHLLKARFNVRPEATVFTLRAVEA